ncbi:hypothetical protein ACFTZK_19160 [Streptomyces decoyicus]|uniref:hypothetical protein n=1 Tax=Streptomyces decoyicus TaxID=249567 RepID=UPI00363AFA35
MILAAYPPTWNLPGSVRVPACSTSPFAFLFQFSHLVFLRPPEAEPRLMQAAAGIARALDHHTPVIVTDAP